LRKLETFFDALDLQDIERPRSRGRRPTDKMSILRALIFKNLRGLPALSDLVIELFERPSLAYILGFEPGVVPPVERFSQFLRNEDNKLLQRIRENLVKHLILSGEIKGKYLSLDTCPIKANVKENNLKTNVRNRFDKKRIPKGDPDAKLGAYVIFTGKEKKVQYFWGYRNHIINDAKTELPLVEVTKPANVHGSTLAIQNLRYIKDILGLHPKVVIGDSEFDSSPILEYILDDMKAKPVIAKNPRGGPPSTTKLSTKGIPICIAGFEMKSRGVFYDKRQNRWRHKFVCPIRASKKFARKHPYCPWFHPKFTEGSGCYRYIRVDVDDSIRHRIDYGSEEFKKIYNMRTSSERVFSRLLSVLMQEPTVKGLVSTANSCTIAHITVLAVAYFATVVKERDKIRFVKSFLQNFQFCEALKLVLSKYLSNFLSNSLFSNVLVKSTCLPLLF